MAVSQYHSIYNHTAISYRKPNLMTSLRTPLLQFCTSVKITYRGKRPEKLLKSYSNVAKSSDDVSISQCIDI